MTAFKNEGVLNTSEDLPDTDDLPCKYFNDNVFIPLNNAFKCLEFSEAIYEIDHAYFYHKGFTRSD